MLNALRTNWPLKLVSLMIAIVLWFYVLGSKDPQTTQAVTVPVRAVNTPADLEVIGITPQSVELRLRGRQSAFRNGDAGRLGAEVQARNATVGENRLPLHVARVPYTLTVLPGYPTTATVEVDKVIRRERPVQYVRRGEPASGFIVDRIVVEPDTVTVVGAASVVSRVARVVVIVDTSGLNSSLEFDAEVEARDSRDVVVNGVSFEPPRVKVTVTVRTVRVKTVPVRPVLGSPPPGWRVATVRSNPLVVTVTGEAGLNELQSVSTAALDISGLRGSKTYAVSLNVPRGLSVLGAASVEVTVTTTSSATSSRPGGAGNEATTVPSEGSPEEESVGAPTNQPQGAAAQQPATGGRPQPSEAGGAPSSAPSEEGGNVTRPAPERPGP